MQQSMHWMRQKMMLNTLLHLFKKKAQPPSPASINKPTVLPAMCAATARKLSARSSEAYDDKQFDRIMNRIRIQSASGLTSLSWRPAHESYTLCHFIGSLRPGVADKLTNLGYQIIIEDAGLASTCRHIVSWEQTK